MKRNEHVEYTEKPVIAVTSRRRVLGGYAAAMALLTAAYYAFPGARSVTWGLIGLGGVGGIVVGILLNKPARRAPWLLLAAAQASFVAGQVSFLTAAQMKAVLPFPSFADVLYLLTYPLYGVAVAIFIRCRSPRGDHRSLTDALTITVGVALLSWAALIRPWLHDPDLTWLQKAVTAAYPSGDLLLLALLVRLLAPGSGRSRCMQFLTLGVAALLASDTAFAVAQLHGAFHAGTVIDVGWACFYAAWGAAALDPSMTRMTDPAARQQEEVSPGRLGILMLASLIAPVVLLTTAPASAALDVSVIAVASAVLYMLVCARLWDAAASHRRALRRERVLREAGLSLVGAADVVQLAAVVRDASAALLGARAQGDALLGIAAADGFHAVGGGAGPPRPAGRPREDLAVPAGRGGSGPHADAGAAGHRPGSPARGGGDAAVPAHSPGQPRRRGNRPDRGLRGVPDPRRAHRDPGDPCPSGRPHGGGRRAARRGCPAPQRSALHGGRAGRLGRHHDHR